ncbi:MAG: glycogen-binding domain-containing protein, partial [Candidatus Marinimicrobia bacterium]|nr:glycogen-binding domain-containing protein [Candidatus Neomarinimicrobiota bacterium]
MTRPFLFLIMAACCGSLTAQTAVAPAAGNGTEQDPWQIASLENLYWIAAADGVVPNPSRSLRAASCYIQTAPIDASPTRTWFSGRGWDPISNFSGFYDGQGHYIDGLFICDSLRSNVGLFGNTYDADIVDLGLSDVDIRGDEYVGALVGVALGYHFNNTHTRISSCYSTGRVQGSRDTGGLIGFNDEGQVYFCYSKASVSSAGSYAGGLVGNNHRTVRDCYSTGPVSLREGSGIHGLIGNVTGDVLACFWDVETSGQPDTLLSFTGAAGITTAEMKTRSTFQDAGWDLSTRWGIYPALNEGYPHLRGLKIPGAATVRFELTLPEGGTFDPQTDSVRITGSFFGWASPGTLPEQKMLRDGESLLWYADLELEPGTYQYKYFLNDGWENGEWDGDPARTAEIASDTVFHNIWGSLSDVPDA